MIERLIPKGLELEFVDNEIIFKQNGSAASKKVSDLFSESLISLKKVFEDNKTDKVKIFPASYNQNALWFHQEMNPENCSYNISFVLKFKGEVSSDAIVVSLRKVSDRHILLRSRFLELNHSEIPLCIVAFEESNPYIEEIEVETLDEAKIKKLIYEKYQVPFNLRADNLLKTYIVKNELYTYVFFNIHHIISDAWSDKIFIKEFLDYLNNKEEIRNQETTEDFNDFIFEQYNYLSSTDGISDLKYWVDKFKNRDIELKLPIDNERKPIYLHKGATTNFQIKDGLYKSILKLSETLNAFPNHIMYSLFDMFLTKISGQKDYNIGITAANRVSNNLKNVFGYFINTFPLESITKEGKSFLQIIDDAKNKFNELTKYQSVPFAKIVEELKGKRDLSRPILFQVLYNFMNQYSLGYAHHFINPVENQFKKFGKFEIAPVKINDQEGQFDLTFEVVQYKNRFECYFKYNTALFNKDTVEHFVSQFLALTEAVTNNPYSDTWNEASQSTEALLPINITGSFTTEPLGEALSFWLNKINLPSKIEFVGFNQIFQQLLNPESDFNSRPNSINIALIRLEDLLNENETLDNNFKRIYKELEESLLVHTQTNTSSKAIVIFCPPSDNYLSNETFVNACNQLEVQIDKLSQNLSKLYIIKTNDFIEGYKLSNYYEPIGEVQGNIPYKNNFFVCAATLIARKIHAIHTPPFKAIALDCDNTLWKGIVGEDGIHGIEIGKQEEELHKFLIKQYDAGILLCLCSKNNENDVWDVFDKNEKMLLKKEHISFSRINWESKSKNLIDLSKEININLDSFVFIDDNPMECEEINTILPSVCTIQKRTDTTDLGYISNSWIFDRNKITLEDKKRSLMYKEEAKRISLKSKFKSYSEFLDELQIRVQFNNVSPNEITRISQLSYRTNQFNFTTIRRTEDEIEALVNNAEYQVLYVHLEDKYGDYGIIGGIIYNEKDDTLSVDTFLLSCRALGKGVEYEMVAYIGECAKMRGKKSIHLHFSGTEKNSVAEKFLDTNFIAYKAETPDGYEYIIPTDFALNFKFQPASVQIKNEHSDNKQQVEVKPNIVNRNNLYNDIIKNYSNINSIVEKIYGVEKPIAGNYQKKTGQGTDQLKVEILSIWQEVLNKPDVKETDNFFDVGGKSILIPNLVIRIKNELDLDLDIVDIFQYSSVNALAEYLSPSGKQSHIYSFDKQNESTIKKEQNKDKEYADNDIAIIGLSGRFPEASNIEEFWELIKSGKEAITHYSRKELENKGVANELLDHPNYVYANGSIPTADKFDAAFFGFTPKEADFMDPQHRVFLESCHEALESAGYSTENYEGSIGIFAGSGPDNYILKNLFQHKDALRNIGEFQTIISNGKDFLTTHASYKLNLNGPSLNIQTACSSSLVAVHYACNSLKNNDSDIALAGGVFIQTPREIGYMYEPGGIFSPLGKCRPFDAKADGTIFGEGVGIVVLKKYKDALRDNDTIWGIIKGSAVNNDGSAKVGYTAPGINGQSNVISRAQKSAGVKPSDISLIEAHGTGTNLGDPVEMKALTNVFRKDTQDKNYCAIGSIKANIGHLDAAAGITGLIKTTLALKNKQIPPCINFEEPNPELQIHKSPFYINTELKEWETNGKPRIAAVSAFGIGGTNAHCIVQEAPDNQSKPSQRKYHIIPVSAKTKAALNDIKNNLASYLSTNKCNVADLAFTLLKGRKRYNYRSAVICGSQDEIIEKIANAAVKTKLFTNPKIVFLFTGQGSQYNQMAKGLYNEFPVFKECMDKAFTIAKSDFDLDLEQIIFSENYKTEINNTEFTQPALFVVQYAMAKLLNSFDISSDALIGHSIGEITAACIAGLFSFEDALKLVITRGRLMQAQKTGSMLSIQLPAAKVKEILPGNLDFALQNAPNFSVVSGEEQDIDSFHKELELKFPEIMLTKLITSHAFHSRMMDPALNEFKEEIADISFNTIDIPFVSNTSGSWANSEMVGNVDYWVNHIRSTVNFVDGINTLLIDKNTIFIEVGPGASLTSLLSQFEKGNQKLVSIPTIRHPRERIDDVLYFFNAIAALWSYGGDKLFDNWYEGETRKRIPLPTYPFERKRHWIDPLVPFNYHVDTKNSYSNWQQNNDSRISDQIEQTHEISTFLHQRPELTTSYTPPSNEIEEKLVQIWQELLGFESIGVNDNFFDLGGHSLLAISLSSEIEEKYSISFGLPDLYKSPTVIGIAECISNKLQEQPE